MTDKIHREGVCLQCNTVITTNLPAEWDEGRFYFGKPVFTCPVCGTCEIEMIKKEGE